jgi:oxygen-independent coproporphyrinogen III oxidase
MAGGMAALDRLPWRWGRGPLLNRQFPWHYPQPHTYAPLRGEDVWRPKRIGVYLHTPFCEEKCDYCNYAVYAHQRPDKVRRYVDALKAEISLAAALPAIRGAVVTSLYFGGGSPSILPNAWLVELFELCRSMFRLTDDAEICIESNPIDIDEEKLATFARMGVNRVSVGVQSFDPETLRSMNRAHSPERAVDAFRLVKAAGIPNVNLDLIYAYPTQTRAQLADTVRRALALEPDRISCASLSIFPKTALYAKTRRGALEPLSEEEEIAMFDICVNEICAAGYDIETILCFTRPGIRFRQEEELLKEGVELLGLGLSAFSVVNGFVTANAPTLPEYLALVEGGRLSVTRGRRLDTRTEMSMAVIHGLRFLQIDRLAFEQRFGVPLELVYGDSLQALADAGLLTRTDRVYRLTHEGMLHVGPIMREFYQEPPVFSQTYQGELVEERSGKVLPLTPVAAN